MFNFFRKKFDPAEDDEAMEKYVDQVLKEKLGVDRATPALIESLPGPAHVATRLIGFGRGRDYQAVFYPHDARSPEADEPVYLLSILKKHTIVPSLAFEDRTPQTRKVYGFDVVVTQMPRFRPAEDPWNSDDLNALAEALRTIHGTTSKIGGKPWRVINPDEEYLKVVEQRWIGALEIVASGLGRRLHPVKEAPFREKAFGRLEVAGRYDLVVGTPWPRIFQRATEGGVLVTEFSYFHYGYREEDLVLMEHLFFGESGPGSKAFLTRYMEQVPPAVQKRYELLQPFFAGLYYLEKMAELVLPPLKKGEKAAPKTAADQMEESVKRASASKLWEAVLEVTGVPEK